MSFINPTPRFVGALCFLFACLFIAPATRAATNAVRFDFAVWSTSPVINKQVKITPHPNSFPRAEGDLIISVDPIYTNSGTAGTITISNMVTGTYIVEFTNRFRNTRFEITTPSTNASGVLTAAELTTSGTNDPSNLVAYSQAAANSRFALRTNAVQRLQTNGVDIDASWGGITNINLIGATGMVSGATAIIGGFSGGGDGGGTNSRQWGSLNLTNWSNIPTGAMANIPAVDWLTNAVSDLRGATNGLDSRVTTIEGATNSFAKLTAATELTNTVNTVSNRTWTADSTFTNVVNTASNRTWAADNHFTNWVGSVSNLVQTKQHGEADLTNWAGAIAITETTNVTLAGTLTVNNEVTNKAGLYVGGAGNSLVRLLDTNTALSVAFQAAHGTVRSNLNLFVPTNGMGGNHAGILIATNAGGGTNAQTTLAAIGSGLSLSSDGKTLTATATGSTNPLTMGSASLYTTNSHRFGETNIIISDTPDVTLNLAAWHIFNVYLLTNANLVFSNQGAGLLRSQVRIQQDTNGQRTVNWRAAGGLLQTNASLQPTTNANALDLLEVASSFYPTNLLAWWPQNFQPRVAFTNSLASGGGGGGGSFSDDFNRADGDSLGGNWTEADTDVDIASNAASAPGGFDNSQSVAIYTGDTCATASQFVKTTLGVAGGNSQASIYFRYTDASSAFYEIRFNVTSDEINWYHWDAIGGTATLINAAPAAVTIADPATVGVTITGTGNSTVVRVWLSPSGDAPDAADDWGGDTMPDVSFTDNPSSAVDIGSHVGIGAGISNNSTVTHDNFFGGDVP